MPMAARAVFATRALSSELYSICPVVSRTPLCGHLTGAKSSICPELNLSSPPLYSLPLLSSHSLLVIARTVVSSLTPPYPSPLHFPKLQVTPLPSTILELYCLWEIFQTPWHFFLWLGPHLFLSPHLWHLPLHAALLALWFFKKSFNIFFKISFYWNMLLLLLSHFSRVQLCATP